MDLWMTLTFWMLCFAFVFILILMTKKQMKIDRKEIALDLENKKIETLLKSQKDSNNYTDFTDGHLYQ
ncbi:hypothetical protein [uncultured Olleya sp.]|uniref:hypothetical protein n=1 Tax=uncultured Olleya sp. TaxID=757243 RepID=UPI0032B13674|tara:strand:+ start:874 stop:1077 length:204 start_codon:yes stop_codon:yes gene_type:complete